MFISFVTRNKGWNVKIIERGITSQGPHHFTSIFQIPLLLGDALWNCLRFGEHRYGLVSIFFHTFLAII